MKDDETRKIAVAPLSSKAFFKWASLALLIPFYKIWETTINAPHVTANVTQKLTLDKNFGEGVHFFEKVILVKNKDEIRLMASTCSHLGCQINKVENGELVCPCHGSRYDLQGKPLKGPATQPLHEVKFEMEKKLNQQFCGLKSDKT